MRILVLRTTVSTARGSPHPRQYLCPRGII
jgi:hypothetical protein